MTNGDYSAFACANDTHLQYGLTKREYFAGLAMQGLVSIVRLQHLSDYEEVSKASIILADELIKQLNSEPCQQAE